MDDKKSLSQIQMKTRPKIDDVISDVLGGEKLEAALEFIAYLKEHKLNLRWASANTWVVKYKGVNILYIRLTGAEFFTHRKNIESGSWLISPPFNVRGDYGDLHNDNHFKQVVWSNVNYCAACIKCKPGKTYVILGKEISGVCHSILNFINPGQEGIEIVKKLLNFGMAEADRSAARNGTASKPLLSTKTMGLVRLG